MRVVQRHREQGFSRGMGKNDDGLQDWFPHRGVLWVGGLDEEDDEDDDDDDEEEWS